MRAPLHSPFGLAALAVTVLALRPVPAGAQVRGLDIHYVPTPEAVVDAMLALARVGPGDVVYDLGSGDGRIPIGAARRHGAAGVGIELDPALISLAKRNAAQAGVAARVRFRKANIFKTDLSKATVVTLYLSSTTNLRLRDKLRRELAPGSRIVSHRFDMGDWVPDEERVVDGIRVFLWSIPPRAEAPR